MADGTTHSKNELQRDERVRKSRADFSGKKGKGKGKWKEKKPKDEQLPHGGAEIGRP